MTASSSIITFKALRLPPAKRAGLVHLLLESLEESPTVDRRLLAELTKRARELRTGKVKGLTTEEAYGFSL